jgi:hypothetical protein
MYSSHAGVYESSKPNSWSPIWAWLTPTTSLADSRDKLGMDPRVNQPACCGLYQEPFLSDVVESVQICQRRTKGCYMWTTWDMYGPRPYAYWAWKACDMLVGFFSVWCTSIRITVTLGYEQPLICGSHYIDNLITWFMTEIGIVMFYYNCLFAILYWLVNCQLLVIMIWI